MAQSIDNDVVMADVDANEQNKSFMTQADTYPFVEKYRPKELSDVKSHNLILTTLRKFAEQTALPHLLFHGPPGTGKTSTALALARCLFGKHIKSMLLELNASDERGINVVRDLIKVFAQTRVVFGMTNPLIGDCLPPKLIILDEADQMTNAAQFALRRVVEEYCGNVRFVIITNNLQKIIPALVSRCTQFRFGCLPPEDMFNHVFMVAKAENMDPMDGTLELCMRLLVKHSGGDMRRVLNLLQAIKLQSDKVTKELVCRVCGVMPIDDEEKLIHLLLNGTFSEAYEHVAQLVKSGIPPLQILERVHDCFTEMSNVPLDLRFDMTARLAKIEVQLMKGVETNIQMMAMVGVFFHVRTAMGMA